MELKIGDQLLKLVKDELEARERLKEAVWHEERDAALLVLRTIREEIGYQICNEISGV